MKRIPKIPKRFRVVLYVAIAWLGLLLLWSGEGKRVYDTWRDKQHVNCRRVVVITREDVMATKTQVTDGSAHLSGTVSVRNQNDYPTRLSAPTKYVSATAGGVVCIIEDITSTGWSGPDPQPPAAGMDRALLFAVYIQDAASNIVDHEFVEFLETDPVPWEIERDFDYSISGNQLWRAESTAAGTGRTGSPVYAKEVTETDSWVAIDPVAYSITFGSLAFAGSAAQGGNPVAVPITVVAFAFNTHKGRDSQLYAQAEDLEWDESEINFARYENDASTVPPNTGVYLDGLAGGIDCYVTAVTSGTTLKTGVLARPYIVDFSVFGVWDRDGLLLALLRISGGFLANNHVPASLTWDTETGVAAVLGDTVFPSVAQLRAIGTWVQVAGLVTGMDFRDADDQYDLLSGAARSFAITEASAREQHIDDTDLNINLRVPPIYATGCDEDTDWPGVAIHRRDDVGVYGPAPALDHTDWAGSGSVGSADATGAFTVTGGGALTLTIPSGYQTRLDDVPGGAAPAGPPTIYMYHKADVWPGEAAEGAYDWRGWQTLELPLTAPGADTLTVTLTYRTYVHTDNHLSDATRTTTYSYVATETTAVYTVPVANGAQTLAISLIAPNDGAYPVLERVVSIAISGFDNGAWVIGEPKLAQAATPRILLKTVEYDYRQGGASIHADAAFIWYDADEDNASHANGTELTVRNFDYRQGAVSGLDLTVAYTLEQFAQLLEQVSEVFICHRADAAFYNAVQDDESPPNTLTSCWSFNVCYPNADSPDANPLQQDVG